MFQVVNRIVELFGSKAVFVEIHSEFVEFRMAGHLYFVSADCVTFEVVNEDVMDVKRTNFSRWVESVLLGKKRNDAGVVA